jgi:hypothetical protein
MKYKLVFFVLMVISRTIFAYDIHTVRNLFYAAADNSTNVAAFISYMEKLNEQNKPEVKAYYGMGYLLMAKYAFNPYSKLSNFNKGKELLEAAIQADSKNAELRFLRLSVQTHAPFFLNYANKVREDEQLIRIIYPTLKDDDLRERIKIFFKENDLTIE